MEKLKFRFLKNEKNFVIRKEKFKNMVFFYRNNDNYGSFYHLVKDFYINNNIKNIIAFNTCFNLLSEQRNNNYFLTIERKKDIEIFKEKDVVYDIIQKSNSVIFIENDYEDFICNFIKNLDRQEKEYPIIIQLGRENLSNKMKDHIIEGNKKGYFFIFYIDINSIGFNNELFPLIFKEEDKSILFENNGNKKYLKYINKADPIHEVFCKYNSDLYNYIESLEMEKMLLSF